MQLSVRPLWRPQEIFGKDEVMRCAIVYPVIFRRNWKNFDAKFEHLTSKGFGKDEMVRCMSKLSTIVLKDFRRARMEVALENGRVSHGGPTLSVILHSTLGAFEKKFEVKL